MSAHIANFNKITHLYDQYRALDGVDFHLPRTGIIGLLGLNGAGKTTIMNLLCGVLTPSEGQVYIGEHSMRLHPKVCKRLIGYAPDRPPLYPDLTASEYLSYAAALRGIARKGRPQAIETSMAAAGVSDYARKLCGHLSHGYRQRLNLAQSIIHRPPLLVLDEPTSGLDPAQIEAVRELIRHLSQNACVLISTHLLYEAQQLCERVLIVHDGKVIEDYIDGSEGGRASRLLLRFAGDSAGPEADGQAPEWLRLMRDCAAIEAVRPEDGASLSCSLRADATPQQARAELIAFVAEHSLDLQEMREDSNDLERRFLNLTKSTTAETEASEGSGAEEAGSGSGARDGIGDLPAVAKQDTAEAEASEGSGDGEAGSGRGARDGIGDLPAVAGQDTPETGDSDNGPDHASAEAIEPDGAETGEDPDQGADTGKST